MLDSGGGRVRFYGVCRDITRRKITELQLARFWKDRFVLDGTVVSKLWALPSCIGSTAIRVRVMLVKSGYCLLEDPYAVTRCSRLWLKRKP